MRGFEKFVLAAIGLTGAVFVLWTLSLGRLYIEKSLTALVMPSALLWLCLIGLCIYFALSAQRRALLCALPLLLLYWWAASPLGGIVAMASLEREFPSVNIRTVEPFDYLFVLGGGVVPNTDGSIKVSASGDRAMLAARLWHAGKAHRLVFSGSSLNADLHAAPVLALATAQIFTDLGVSEDAMETIAGRNTSEEMVSFAALVEYQPSARIGLLSSAWHLPRALRLARTRGLQFVPVPADMRSREPRIPLPLALIPAAGGMLNTSHVMKERLAAMVSR